MKTSKVSELIGDIAKSKGIPDEVVKNSLLKSILYGYKIELYKAVKNDLTGEYEFDKDSKKQDKIDDIEARLEIDKKGKLIVLVKKTVTKKPKLLLREISLKDAKKIDSSVSENDVLEVPIDYQSFSKNIIKEIQKKFDEEIKFYSLNKITENLSSKLNKLVNAKILRITGKAIYASLEDSQFECIITNNDISRSEDIEVGKTKLFLLYKIEKVKNKKIKWDGTVNSSEIPVEVYLTRTKPEFIMKLFEAEVPEIANGEVKILKIAREVGFKTKVLVKAVREGIEPVGACLGIKGYRIQNIRKELGGEVVEVIPYSDDPAEMIKNSLNLERLMDKNKNFEVLTISADKKIAILIVPDSESQANIIGRDGINVKLAVELTGWKIDIKTREEFEKSEYAHLKSIQFENIFQGSRKDTEQEEYEEVSEDAAIDEFIEFLGKEIINKLKSAGIDTIEKLIDYSSTNRLQNISKLTTEEFLKIDKFIKENVDIQEVEEVEEEVATCPNCNNEIPLDALKCPYCGYEFEE
ncbi:MAG: hypothetical protein N3A58_09085 [Spirochaetes bacterium]|nr:hypothetical protein [Spirochaetota bacterium]